MRWIGPVMDAARRRVCDQDVEEAATPDPVHHERRQHPQNRDPHVRLAGLKRALVVAGRSFEAADEQPVYRCHAAVQVDAVPPDLNLVIIQGLGRHVVIPVHRPEGSGDRCRHVVEIVVGEVAACEHEIDAAGARG